MSQLPPGPSVSRDEILAILLAAALGAGIGVAATYAVQKAKAASRPAPRSAPLAIDVDHSVVVPKPLKDIAAEAGMQPPTALVHLRKLEEEGKVHKVATAEGPRYAVQPFLRCEWIDPDHGMHETWQAKGVDWRFPLVSRVRDEPAQRFLLEWLDRAQARNLLPTPLSRWEPAKPARSMLSIVVYGSCARGDAGAKSDIDILVRSDLPKKQADALKALAHEVALKGGRRPDVRIVTHDLKGAGPALVEALRHEGRTVFTNLPDGHFIESKVAWLHA